ncbi:formate dehydrogenase subunit gamma [Ciceribacter thiooxidans]|uniref:Formate dehydrogenase subunit gamma n=1 Tax=Ciceribacter thiooxidans TaxID=1969821 RepID=A0ABV7HU43_9HYPH|nr:formate dehydrogenase subunit gamma [Ciceribacter thiooxidans]MDI6837350.1 formate dehydrogenase subunit gamma [Rhizobiaceae bacterium]
MNIRSSVDDILSRTSAIVEEHKRSEGPLLPILHAVQEAFGFIPEDAKPLIAQALNLSRAEVHGVVSFYHDFRSEPSGRHVLKLCRGEACQSMGADRLADELKRLLDVEWGGTTADGAVTVEPVFCLGLCACAPSAMLDGQVHGRLDGESCAALIAEVRR